MDAINGLVDPNDVARLREVLPPGVEVASAQCCPLSEDGQINPHVSRFWLTDGRRVDLFHVKPVYYQTHDLTWRPLSEVTEPVGNLGYHGNHRIEITRPEKVRPYFLEWLRKRQALLPGGSLVVAGEF